MLSRAFAMGPRTPTLPRPAHSPAAAGSDRFAGGATDRQREFARARAGFTRRVAEPVLACADVEAIEALARGGLG